MLLINIRDKNRTNRFWGEFLLFTPIDRGWSLYKQSRGFNVGTVRQHKLTSVLRGAEVTIITVIRLIRGWCKYSYHKDYKDAIVFHPSLINVTKSWDMNKCTHAAPPIGLFHKIHRVTIIQHKPHVRNNEHKKALAPALRVCLAWQIKRQQQLERGPMHPIKKIFQYVSFKQDEGRLKSGA